MSTIFVDERAEVLARFLFHCFVVVADADDALAPREVESFDERLAACPASMPRALREACEALRARYAELWKAHQAGQFGRSPQSVGTQWTVLAASLGGEAAPFAAALLDLLADVVKAGSPLLTRLGLASKKMRALEQVRQLLLARGSAAQAQPPARDADIVAPVPDGATPWPDARLAPERMRAWTRGKLHLRCVAVVPETHDVKSFFFTCDEPVLFTFRPGQFVTFDVPIEGRAVRRSYTISSSPSRPHLMSITVKHVPGGVASAWLHGHMAPGEGLTVFGPNGDFTCLEAASPNLLLIAAGSGITPLMSMLRWLSDTFLPCDVTFLNFVRSPDDVIFHEELRQCSFRMGARLRLTTIPAGVRQGQTWSGPVGHVSPALLQLLAPDLATREAFVCGPGAFMDAVKPMLLAAGLPESRYHQESFGGSVPRLSPQPLAPRAAEPPAAPAPEPAASAEIVFARSGRTIACTADDVILEVAEANGIQLASSCRSGTCGTCRVRRLEGTVDLEDQRALSGSDLADGLVLACVGRARGRVVLDA